MDERFLHYIWKLQKFDSSQLRTTTGGRITVFKQGNHNHHSGPDFEEARIKIGTVEWAGSVEIHIRSSDWNRHNHHQDRAYDNVILHVVWEDDKPLEQAGELIPTLELKQLVDQQMLAEYQNFISQEKDILCGDQLGVISEMNFNLTLDRMVIERLEEKARVVLKTLEATQQDWEETTYRLIAKNFGFSTNAEPFLLLAESLSRKVLTKYHQSTKSTEALIFGQAGFLDDSSDPYQAELRKEYEYLKEKHSLKQRISKAMWKFGKMRPANFPTVRLAQVSVLFSSRQHLFSDLVAEHSPLEIIKIFELSTTDYWQEHYDFGKERSTPSWGIGKSTQQNLLINTVAPLLAAYSSYTGDTDHMDRAVALLEATKPESNNITKKWTSLGKKPKSAMDAQAMIGLYKNYCAKKNCLNCSIGAEILGR